MNIANHTIALGRPVFVIAEIGVNHDGSVERALELVAAAQSAGADAVKVQIFKADSLMNAAAAFATYQSDRVADATPAEMLRRYELSKSDTQTVVNAIRSAGMVPIATPFSPSDLAMVAALDLPAIKIASPDLVNRPLLEATAKLGRPMLLSTGAATMAEVSTTVAWLRDWRATFSLLHCVSSYPTGVANANLGWINELAARFDVPIGYSDHTTDPLAGAFAVSAGAAIVEKHLTYDRAAAGPDHSASADPAQFRDYVRMIRHAEILRGQPGKRVLEIEQDVRRVSRQSLVLTRSVAPGQLIREADLVPQRPGTGIPAAELAKVLGRSVARAIAAGTLLTWEMLSDAA